MPGKPGILSFSFPGLEFAHKWLKKKLEFLLKIFMKKKKTTKFINLVFQDSLFKMSFENLFIYIFTIYTLSTQIL